MTLFLQGDWLYAGARLNEPGKAPRWGIVAFETLTLPLRRGHSMGTDIIPINSARVDDYRVLIAGQTWDPSSPRNQAALELWDLRQPNRPERLRGWKDSGEGSSALLSVTVLKGRVYAAAADSIGGASRIDVLDVAHGDAIEKVLELRIAGHSPCEWPITIAATATVVAVLGTCVDDSTVLFTVSPLHDPPPRSTLTIPPLGSISFPLGWTIYSFYQKPIAVAGDHLYILGGNEPDIDTLRIVDVSAPEAPVVVGRLR